MSRTKSRGYKVRLRIQKQPFVLLEVLIAIGLFTLLLSPLISMPFKAQTKDLENLYEMEILRQQDRAFLAVLRELQRSSFYTDSLEKEVKLYPEELITISLPGAQHAFYFIEASAKTVAPKKTIEPGSTRLVAVDIQLIRSNESRPPGASPKLHKMTYKICLSGAKQTESTAA